MEQLKASGLAYPCGCTRKDIEAAWDRLGWIHERHVERPYPGTCRDGLHGKSPAPGALRWTTLPATTPCCAGRTAAWAPSNRT